MTNAFRRRSLLTMGAALATPAVAHAWPAPHVTPVHGSWQPAGPLHLHTGGVTQPGEDAAQAFDHLEEVAVLGLEPLALQAR